MDNFMTTAEYLNTLIDCKQDMKSAIEGKGVTVTGGLSTYADAIRRIEDDLVVGSLPDKTKLWGNLWTVGPELDTSAMTDMNGMFLDCDSMTTVPLYNTSNVTNMNGMFESCNALTTVPQFDTSKVTDMSYMFFQCYSLTTVPLFDTSSVTDVRAMFEQCYSLTTVGGLKDLGKQSSLAPLNGLFGSTDNLTYESAMNVINNLYDRATAGYSVLTLWFPDNVLALLSDEDIAIATNKGWTIS